MANEESAKKSAALKAVLVRYQSEMAKLKKELSVAVNDYQEVLRTEKLKQLKENILHPTS